MNTDQGCTLGIEVSHSNFKSSKQTRPNSFQFVTVATSHKKNYTSLALYKPRLREGFYKLKATRNATGEVSFRKLHTTITRRSASWHKSCDTPRITTINAVYAEERQLLPHAAQRLNIATKAGDFTVKRFGDTSIQQTFIYRRISLPTIDANIYKPRISCWGFSKRRISLYRRCIDVKHMENHIDCTLIQCTFRQIRLFENHCDNWRKWLS